MSDILSPKQPLFLTGSGTTYDFYVQSDCGTDSSTWVGPSSFATYASCGDNVQYCYGPNDQTVLIGEVSTPGDQITITVNAGETEAGFDDLIVYEGIGTGGTQLYNADGNHAGVSVTSLTGSITVAISGDGSYNCQDGLGGPYTPLDIDVTCSSPPACLDPTSLSIAMLSF